MRQDIKNSQARERDYIRLQAQIADLELRSRALATSNDDAERDFQTRVEGQDRTIKYYENDIKQLKEQNQNSDSDSRDLYEEIQSLKADTQDREGEIYGL